jgi:hypothetical protein
MPKLKLCHCNRKNCVHETVGQVAKRLGKAAVGLKKLAEKDPEQKAVINYFGEKTWAGAAGKLEAFAAKCAALDKLGYFPSQIPGSPHGRRSEGAFGVYFDIAKFEPADYVALSGATTKPAPKPPKDH